MVVVQKASRYSLFAQTKPAMSPQNGGFSINVICVLWDLSVQVLRLQFKAKINILMAVSVHIMLFKQTQLLWVWNSIPNAVFPQVS